jgi:protein-S-isoprenylcysteine O-methyltransferase Ste14
MLKTLSVLGYLTMIAGLAGLMATKHLLFTSPVVIALQGMALFLMIWARITFGRRSFHFAANPTEGGLVTDGPYRFIRHPIYAAVLIFCWAGFAAGSISWGAILCRALILAGCLMRIACEEKLVTARYPEYAAYAAKTWRVMPCVY